MKSIMFYEADDEGIPQEIAILDDVEVFKKLKEICEQKWPGRRGWTFKEWWARWYEDLWCYIKRDETVMTATKLKTSGMWYAKGEDAQKRIYEDMEKLVDGFLAELAEDCPEPPELEDVELDEEDVLSGVIERIEL